MKYALLFLTALLITLQKITQKRYNAKCRSGVFFFGGMISFFAMCFFMAVNRAWEWNIHLVIPAVAFGLSYAAATVFVVLAIKNGSLAKTALVTSYSLLVPAFAGLMVLKEPMGVPMIAGMILLAVSLWLTNYKKSTDKSQEKITLKWVIFVALGFAGNGICSTVQKLTPHFVEDSVLNQNMYMIAALGLSSLVLIAASFITGETDLKSTLRYGTPLALLCGLFNGAVNYLVIYLNSLLPASVMFPVLSAGALILIFPYSLLICREKFTKGQWVGFAIGVLSVVLLNL